MDIGIGIGAGAMTVSHANVSFFWMVTSLGGLTPEQDYKTHNTGHLLEGLAAMVMIFALWLVFR